MPKVRAVDGCVGVSLLVDRQSGRCIFTSAWETEQALRSGLELVQPMRARAEESERLMEWAFREFEAVVLPLSSGPPVLLTRNLLYTAVTRARRLVVVVGREEVMRRMVESDRIARRYSALAERLRAMSET